MGSLLDLAQLSAVTDPLNHTTTFGYDPKSNLKTITNALGKITMIDVNTQGQPITIKDPLNNQTTFTYELGDLISVKAPLNRETKRMLDAAREQIGAGYCALRQQLTRHGSPIAS
jgi:YD repeat-containing protein